MPKHILILFLAFGIFILFSAPFAAYFLSPIGGNAQEIDFRVEKGEGIKDIASRLENARLIKSSGTFVVYSALTGAAHRLKSGDYQLSQSMSLPTIIALLEEGPQEDITIFVREGEALAEIESKLVKANVIKPRALSKFPGKSLEGFLYPDTYRFFPNSPTKDVVKKFLSNFNKKAMPVLSEAKGDYYKTLIVASIIEKEVPFQEDRHLVAGILYKRLKIGMPLQVDAYPWTYDHYGLPSKPISNPGVEAIRAAVYPKESEYLYYLSDPATDKTIFSKTFEEHRENRWKYLKK